MPLQPFHKICNEDGRHHTKTVYTRCFRRLHLLQASDTRVFCDADVDGPEAAAVGEVAAITGFMSPCAVPDADLGFAIVMLIFDHLHGRRQNLSR